jgi:hypothetical protein
MKLLKTCSHNALGCEGAKNSGFFASPHPMWRSVRAHFKLFCQTIYQNGSCSTDRVVYGAEAPKNNFIGEVEPRQIEPKY